MTKTTWMILAGLLGFLLWLEQDFEQMRSAQRAHLQQLLHERGQQLLTERARLLRDALDRLQMGTRSPISGTEYACVSPNSKLLSCVHREQQFLPANQPLASITGQATSSATQQLLPWQRKQDPHGLYLMRREISGQLHLWRIPLEGLLRTSPTGSAPPPALRLQLSAIGKLQSMNFNGAVDYVADESTLEQQHSWEQYGYRWQLILNYPAQALETSPDARYQLLAGLLACALAWAIGRYLHWRTLARRQQADQDILQEELADSERNYRLLVEQIPGVVFRSRASEQGHQLLLSNPAIQVLTGYPLQALLDEQHPGFSRLIHPADLGRVCATLAPLATQVGNYQLEYRLQDSQGHWHWVVEFGQARQHPAGSILIDGVIFDMTSQKQAQYALQDSADMLHAIIEHAPGILIQGYSVDGRVRFWNRASAELLGWQENEVLQRQAGEFMLDARGMLSLLAALTQAAQTQHNTPFIELALLTRDGDSKTYVLTFFPAGNFRDEEVYICLGLPANEHPFTVPVTEAAAI